MLWQARVSWETAASCWAACLLGCGRGCGWCGQGKRGREGVSQRVCVCGGVCLGVSCASLCRGRSLWGICLSVLALCLGRLGVSGVGVCVSWALLLGPGPTSLTHQHRACHVSWQGCSPPSPAWQRPGAFRTLPLANKRGRPGLAQREE